LEVSKNQVVTPADCINGNPVSVLSTEGTKFSKCKQGHGVEWCRCRRE